MDVKYLPQMPDEDARPYLFAAIDRATRWVYVEILPTKCASNVSAFLKRLIKAAPFKLSKVLTDNGKEFSDRFCASGERQPTGHHAFDKVCAKHHIEHRLIKPKSPQTNGVIERFNGRIADVLATTQFDSSENLAGTLLRYVKVYNQHIPQRALGHVPPIQAMKKWYEKHPALFKKCVYNHPGLDTRRVGGGTGEQEHPHRLGAARAWPGLRGGLRDGGMNAGFPPRRSPRVVAGPPAGGAMENPAV